MTDDVLATRPDLGGATGLPAHARIATWLEQLIASRALASGDKLPAEVDIAAALGVSRMTLRQALAAIEAKGLIRRSRGRFGGNFVEVPRLEFDHTGLPGFTEQMRRLDMIAGAALVSAKTCRPAAAVREALALKRGCAGARDHPDPVGQRARPSCSRRPTCPRRCFPACWPRDLTGSLYALMVSSSAPRCTRPTNTSRPRRRPRGAPNCSGCRWVIRCCSSPARPTDRDGVAVEFSHDYFRADRSRIRVKSWDDRDTQARVETSPAS